MRNSRVSSTERPSSVAETRLAGLESPHEIGSYDARTNLRYEMVRRWLDSLMVTLPASTRRSTGDELARRRTLCLAHGKRYGLRSVLALLCPRVPFFEWTIVDWRQLFGRTASVESSGRCVSWSHPMRADHHGRQSRHRRLRPRIPDQSMSRRSMPDAFDRRSKYRLFLVTSGSWRDTATEAMRMSPSC